jgi:hypothetical protein
VAKKVLNMLEVTVIPDSPVAEIFAAKCCGGGLPDQNFEIRITNHGRSEIAIQSRFRLEGAGDLLDWRAVCPEGGRRIAPEAVAALYADLDPAIAARFLFLVLFDDEGRAYRFPMGGGVEIADHQQQKR